MKNENVKTRKMKQLSGMIFGFIMLCSFSLIAQQGSSPDSPQQNVKEDYSDKELKEFIDVNKEVAKVQQESQGKMINAIEDEGLDVNTFNEIMSSQQNQEQSINVPDGDLDKFDKAVEKVMVIQQNMESEVSSAIVESGMEVEKYEEIMLAYQYSPVVQEKVHKLLRIEEQEK